MYACVFLCTNCKTIILCYDMTVKWSHSMGLKKEDNLRWINVGLSSFFVV